MHTTARPSTPQLNAPRKPRRHSLTSGDSFGSENFTTGFDKSGQYRSISIGLDFDTSTPHTFFGRIKARKDGVIHYQAVFPLLFVALLSVLSECPKQTGATQT